MILQVRNLSLPNDTVYTVCGNRFLWNALHLLCCSVLINSARDRAEPSFAGGVFAPLMSCRSALEYDEVIVRALLPDSRSGYCPRSCDCPIRSDAHLIGPSPKIGLDGHPSKSMFDGSIISGGTRQEARYHHVSGLPVSPYCIKPSSLSENERLKTGVTADAGALGGQHARPSVTETVHPAGFCRLMFSAVRFSLASADAAHREVASSTYSQLSAASYNQCRGSTAKALQKRCESVTVGIL